MLYKSIKEFSSLVDKCPFCKEPLATGLFPTGDVGLISKSYSTISNFKANRITSIANIGRITFNNSSGSHTYESIQNGDILHFNLIVNKNEYGVSRNKIFEIDTNSNIVSGAPIDNIRRVMDENHLSLLRRCVHDDCVMTQYDFAYQSSPLIVGTKSSVIYPVKIAIEVIVVVINGKKFCLITNPEQRATYILGNKTLITTLPMIHLHNMLEQETIINKIKLYVLFS